MNILLTIENKNYAMIQLKRGSLTIDREPLTIDKNLDTLLIVAVDKLLKRNTMVKLRLKRAKIEGRLIKGAVSGMIISAFKSSLEI